MYVYRYKLAFGLAILRSCNSKILFEPTQICGRYLKMNYRNVWQSLACSPPGIVVSPLSKS